MASDSTPRKYTLERAEGYLSTIQLLNRLVIPGPTTATHWSVGQELSVVDDVVGLRIVAGTVEERVDTAEYQCRSGGRREIHVRAAAVRECLDAAAGDDLAIYDDDGDLLVVQSRPDPILAREQRGEW